MRLIFSMQWEESIEDLLLAEHQKAEEKIPLE
jgi:hypothetical protein